jgi:tetratricopeptide (TPR) repeat protein
VSSLFTREFFESARARLAPGGVICQWANAYNISEPDLKSIVATFLTVFPNGTVWLVGGDDVLLLATLDPIDEAVARLPQKMTRPDVAADLASIGVVDPFSIQSLFVAGPETLRAYAGDAPIFTDDRMTLEFSAPRELHKRTAGENGAALRRLSHNSAPAHAAQWRNRAAMLARADHHQLAYDDYVRAIKQDPNDSAALEGLVKAALILKKPDQALEALDKAGAAAVVARSKLLAAAGKRDDALRVVREADASPEALEQLASLYADSADTIQLDATVGEMLKLQPERAATHYFRAVAAFIHGDAGAAVTSAQRAIAIDPNYTPTYDLIGAAYTKLGQLDPAREAFKKSLAFDAHDSTAYENLGVLELNAGNRALAARYFAEALWLVPESPTARQGLAQARP